MEHKFLSVLTRTHKRPQALLRCINSLNRQTKNNFSVIVISDHKEDNVISMVKSYPNLSIIVEYVEALGYPLCNTYFNKVRDIINSDYVVFIDDDDEIIDEKYFEVLQDISTKENYPKVIMSRALFTFSIGKRVIPGNNLWGKFPILYNVSTLNFCVRSDVYKKYDWPGVKCGDYYFISAIFNNIDWKKDAYWHDKVTTAVTHIGSLDKSYQDLESINK